MDCKKDIFYRFMNNPGIDWRKLLYYLNLQLWSKIKVRSEHKSENACLIVDDTDYPKNGRRTENMLVHQGVAITTVQKLLGHTSVKTTQIYSEVLSSTIVRDLKNVQRKKVKMFPDKGLRTSDFIDNR